MSVTLHKYNLNLTTKIRLINLKKLRVLSTGI
jgi:hypothetical protein